MYATVDELRAYLRQVGDSSADTTLLTDCLTRATGRVRERLRALLADPSFDYAEYAAAAPKVVQGYRTDYLALPAHQLGSVTAVEYQSGTSPLTWAAIADTWAQESGRLYRPAGWGAERYRITAVWGYGPTIPAAVEEVALEIAVNIWRSRDKGGFSETIGADGGGQQRTVAGLTRAQEQALADVAASIWSPSL